MGRPVEAIAVYRVVLARREAELGADDLSTLSTAMNLGTLLLSTNRDLDQATDLLERVAKVSATRVQGLGLGQCLR